MLLEKQHPHPSKNSTLSDLWYKAMVDFVCVSPIILMVKFKFEKVKVCVIVTHGSSDGNAGESAISEII